MLELGQTQLPHEYQLSCLSVWKSLEVESERLWDADAVPGLSASGLVSFPPQKQNSQVTEM